MKRIEMLAIIERNLIVFFLVMSNACKYAALVGQANNYAINTMFLFIRLLQKAPTRFFSFIIARCQGQNNF
jgi:hypothetical protein